jgi:hypothetical protein
LSFEDSRQLVERTLLHAEIDIRHGEFAVRPLVTLFPTFAFDRISLVAMTR